MSGIPQLPQLRSKSLEYAETLGLRSGSGYFRCRSQSAPPGRRIRGPNGENGPWLVLLACDNPFIGVVARA